MHIFIYIVLFFMMFGILLNSWRYSLLSYCIGMHKHSLSTRPLASFPGPRPASHCKRREAGRGPGNEATRPSLILQKSERRSSTVHVFIVHSLFNLQPYNCAGIVNWSQGVATVSKWNSRISLVSISCILITSSCYIDPLSLFWRVREGLAW